MNAITKTALVALTTFAIGASAKAQFNIGVNPNPVRNNFDCRVDISVFKASDLPGRIGNTDTRVTAVGWIKHRRSGSYSKIVRTFRLRKDSNTAASGITRFNFNNRDWKGDRVEWQILLPSGLQRTFTTGLD